MAAKVSTNRRRAILAGLAGAAAAGLVGAAVAPRAVAQTADADPAKMPPLSFPAYLKEAIPKTACSANAHLVKNKKDLYEEALRRFGHAKSEAALFGLSDPTYFAQAPGKPAAYFKDAFKSRTMKEPGASSRYYSYVGAKGFEHYWVDFANAQVGGGAFGCGHAQEETMCLEIPELADAAAFRVVKGEGSLLTRSPLGGVAVLAGSPRPLVIAPVRRALDLDGVDVTADYAKAGGIVATLRNQPALSGPLNVLAVAAPDVSADKKAKPWDLATIQDLFNTATAAFMLAHHHANGKKAMIQTGRLGAGVFGNDVSLVYVVQLLAAEHADVEIAFWAYAAAEAKACYALYQKVDRKGSIEDVLKSVSALRH